MIPIIAKQQESLSLNVTLNSNQKISVARARPHLSSTISGIRLKNLCTSYKLSLQETLNPVHSLLVRVVAHQDLVFLDNSEAPISLRILASKGQRRFGVWDLGLRAQGPKTASTIVEGRSRNCG